MTSTLLRGAGVILALQALSLSFALAQEETSGDAALPCSGAEVRHHTAYRASGPLVIDGRLEEADWAAAPWSPRFVDLISGERTLFDTRAAVLWDDAFLYIAFKV